MSETLNSLAKRIRACRLCEAELPLGPRPVIRVNPKAQILVAGQAPGTRVHESGIPFDDPSGDRLRRWMGIESDTFYNEQKIAIVPMGFCYPGKGDWGDLPPMKRCAQTWREALLNKLPDIKLVLAIGQYAVKWHLPGVKGTLTELVQMNPDLSGDVLVLPHPSPRNNIWLSKNRWFEKDVVPKLQDRVERILDSG